MKFHQPRIILLLILFSSSLTNNLLQSEKNVYTEFNFQTAKPNIIESGTIRVGFSATKPLQYIKTDVWFRLDSNDIVIIENSDQTKPQGIVCDKSINCEKDSTKINCPTSFDETEQCTKGNALIRFSDLNTSATDYKGLDFYLSPSFASSQYSKNGEFGLGPKSPYWSWLFQSYETSDGIDFIEHSFFYQNDGEDGSFYSIDSIDMPKSKFSFNGRGASPEPAVQITNMNVSSDLWIFEGADVSLTGGKASKKRDICLESSQNYLIGLAKNEQIDLIKKMNQKMCGKDDNCKTSDTGFNLNAVDDIVMIFKQDGNKIFKVEYKPKDFIFIDKDGLVTPMIGLKSDKCKDISIGRGGLTKTEFIIRAYSSTKFEIGFNQTIPGSTEEFEWILLGMGSILLVTALLIAICSKGSKKKQERQVNAATINNKTEPGRGEGEGYNRIKDEEF